MFGAAHPTTSKFEVRTTRTAITVIGYWISMGNPPLANLENDQKFDAALVEQLAKIIEVLSNLED